MANLVPGFRWEPVDVGNRAARRKGRGLIGHVAVSGSANLRPGALATRSSDWHFYLPKVGPGIQQIDLDVQCWASSAGNATMPAFESQGGLGTSAQLNAEPWTDDQCEAAAQILAHLNRTEGTPLQVMANSLPGSKGFGTHRLGISPWRVVGGEVWSSANGKECPGNAKVAQVPRIVARAQQILGGATAVNVQEDDVSWSDNLGSQGGIGDPTNGATAAQILWHATIQASQASAKADAIQQQLAGLQGALNALAGAVASGRDDLTAEELRTMIHEEMVKVIDVQVTVNGASR